ncbi:hypothetical protein Dsin_021355 [Dipteronia sinensis]|uniref:Uncharacterized protein n=1 Tax=Dipteronia sinensis TaxID=43782 RepID=A0AAD9ZZI7_9ROSI|nr:hypothetical protein Dsin_021355 [Dipteronia sinensis]
MKEWLVLVLRKVIVWGVVLMKLKQVELVGNVMMVGQLKVGMLDLLVLVLRNERLLLMVGTQKVGVLGLWKMKHRREAKEESVVTLLKDLAYDQEVPRIETWKRDYGGTV